MRWPWQRKPTDHYWGGAVDFTAADFDPGGRLFWERPTISWARRREGELRKAMQREHAMDGRYPVERWEDLHRGTVTVTHEWLASAMANVEAKVRADLAEMGYDEKAIEQIVAPRVGQWRADAEVAHEGRSSTIGFYGGPPRPGPPRTIAELHERLTADQALYGGPPYHVAPPPATAHFVAGQEEPVVAAPGSMPREMVRFTVRAMRRSGCTDAAIERHLRDHGYHLDGAYDDPHAPDPYRNPPETQACQHCGRWGCKGDCDEAEEAERWYRDEADAEHAARTGATLTPRPLVTGRFEGPVLDEPFGSDDERGVGCSE